MEWKQASVTEDGVSIPERWVHLHYYEAFNLLFRIENALRMFVYLVLKTRLRDKWADAQVLGEDEQGTLASLAKLRMARAQTFGYLGHQIACPIMHLNSGELTRLIVSDSYWRLFKPWFHGSKDIIKNKLDEVGSIRNSLAHFRPIRRDDVEVLKQNSKHVLLGIEQFFNQALAQSDVVPTNTEEDWYRNLVSLKGDYCTLSFQQSPDGQWIRVEIKYVCPVINRQFYGDAYRTYAALTIRSSAALALLPGIVRNVCYLAETVHYPRMLMNGDAEFRKVLSLVLCRSVLESSQTELGDSVRDLLDRVDEETELILHDHLARGQLVHTDSVTAIRDGNGWRWSYHTLKTPVLESDPPEYWGDLQFDFPNDLIAATAKYPWMPDSISTEESPF